MDVSELIEVVRVQPDGAGAGGAADRDAADGGGERFVGHSPADRTRSVYGGQFLAQALMAAAATVEPGRLPHSLHAYFVRAGLPQTPISYRVERVRDGRNFSHRNVVATQAGKEVFRQMLSFQVPGPGLEHQEPFTVAPGTDPSSFPDYRQWVAELSDNVEHAWFHEQVPVELRFQDAPPPRPRQALGGVLRIWMRLNAPVPSDDPVLHAALLAWMSDKTISDVTMYPHARTWTDRDTDILSLDHTMWFFAPCRADRWTLFTHETPATGAGRGLARGDIVDLEGRRLGALAQEALLLAP